MIEYNLKRRLHYIPGGAIRAEMGMWPSGGIGTTDLVSWWSLDETSGTRNDSHGTNHLTDNNTVAYAAGKKGNAADFERSNGEYLTRNDNDGLSGAGVATDFTYACWVWLESNPATVGHSMHFGGKWNAGANAEWGVYQVNDVGTVKTRLIVSHDGSTLNALDAASTASIEAWHLVIVWHDNVADKIYIQIDNGTPDEKAHTTGIYNGTSPFQIGTLFVSGSAAGNTYMDGLIDEASFWKRVLTADERTWLWNGGAGRTYSDL